MAPRLARGDVTPEELADAMSPKVRIEKIAHKDQKLRTFITEDAERGALVSHVYDATPGVVGPDDSLVVIDDSIVRGTTLRDSVVAMLSRLNPKRIVVVSSAPPICYPDCYGIDMSQLEKFVAFQAAMAFLRERGEGAHIEAAYQKCKAQRGATLGEYENHVTPLYDRVEHEDLEKKIAEMLRPKRTRWKGELVILYQTIEGLHEALPEHRGDWYFTGDYPTPGGYRVLNTSFINAHEGLSRRAY
jgi:amidophosphoribosyltransferase